MKECQYCGAGIPDDALDSRHRRESLDDQKQETGQPRTAARAKKKRTSFWSWKVTPAGLLIIGLVLLGGALVALPSFLGARTRPSPNACINNLRQIDAAKEQWALANNKSPGDPVNEGEVDKYIKGGRPLCEKGGTYIYGKVGEKPRCTIPDHYLP